MEPKITHPQLADLFFLTGLLLYIVAGMTLAPFHGDEATIIYLSKDWYRIISVQNLPTIFYREHIADPRQSDEQEFRLQNGVISKYAIGLFASVLGQPIEAINDPWFWGSDFNDNVAHGHIPRPVVLWAGRLSSTFMLIVSVALVFRIGRDLRDRWLAWTAAFVYATLPSVLLNGRRSMFEGATLLAVALVIFASMRMVRSMNRREIGAFRRWRGWIGFGLACGFAISTKDSLLIIVAPAALALLLYHWRSFPKLVVSGVCTSTLFLLLNPAWWTAPLQVPGVALHLREGILQAQVNIFGGYQNTLDRFVALARYPLGSAQYFEDKQNWHAWIGDQITAYERSGLGGIDWNNWTVCASGLIGLVSLVIKRRPPDLVFAGISVFAAVALLIATPLPWQRYYLPLAPFWAVLIGSGVTTVVARFVGPSRRLKSICRSAMEVANLRAFYVHQGSGARKNCRELGKSGEQNWVRRCAISGAGWKARNTDCSGQPASVTDAG